MGAFGSLSPCGLLRFGAAPSDAQVMYDSLQAGSAKAFDTSEGTHVEASNYARAILYAGARRALHSGADQLNPAKVTGSLPDLETLYEVIPSADASDEDRRQELVAKQAISGGSRQEALITALTALLGTDFVRVRTIAHGEIVASASPGTRGAWRDPALPHLFWTLDRSIPVTGIPFTVGITALSTDTTELPKVGDVLCVEAEKWTQAEAITVSAVDTVARTITATFTRAHDAGASVLTHAPMYCSNQRTLLVGVKTASATDAVLHGKTLDLLFRIVRGVTAARPVATAGGVTAGPFTLTSSPLGITPVGTVTL